MRNLDFLVELLVSDYEYWVVSKRNESPKSDHFKDSIMLIVIPLNIDRGLKRDEIKLSDLERLLHATIHGNIFLNEDYPPFQYGQSFYNIHMGFPVTSEIYQFMIDALALKSDDIFEYKKLIKTCLIEH